MLKKVAIPSSSGGDAGVPAVGNVIAKRTLILKGAFAQGFIPGTENPSGICISLLLWANMICCRWALVSMRVR